MAIIAAQPARGVHGEVKLLGVEPEALALLR
jgi:hypothetical protein